MQNIAIYISDLDGASIPMSVSPQLTPDQLKSEIARQIGVSSNRLILSYGGKPLLLDCQIADYEITDGSTLTLNVPLKGGGCRWGNVARWYAYSLTPHFPILFRI